MTAAPLPPRRGRGRPRAEDAADTRSRILRAAAEEFGRDGYEAVSLRAVARAAGVDSALVHHYFEDKADLFTQAIDIPIRPDRVVQAALAGPRADVGANLVRSMLLAFERPGTPQRALGLLRTALGHEFAAAMLRQFLVGEILHRVSRELAVPDGELRATLAASQMIGLVVLRYGIRAEPVASATIDELVARAGPAVQWHLVGYPGDVPPARADP